ncbi:MAG TPA: 30S ribosomal protein S7 [Anaerolineales bacterium]|nr:30S ribosomal protein S7 [Anaerolineales bacterium]
MSRRFKPTPREVAPDTRYGSTLVTMFLNRMMYSGKKSVAIGVLYGAMDLVEKRTKRNGLDVLKDAIKTVSPAIEVRPRRVGGATYQVPMEVEPYRRQTLAMRWLINAARARSGRSMIEKLAGELMDAANGTGNAVKRRDEVHKIAESNRAFSHFRW